MIFVFVPFRSINASISSDARLILTLPLTRKKLVTNASWLLSIVVPARCVRSALSRK